MEHAGIDKELINKTRSYAKENRVISWAYTLSTFAILVVLIFAVYAVESDVWRMLLSIPIALMMVRAFCLYHDFQHHAILTNSLIARLLFDVYGLLHLTPNRVWRETHNFHHAHVAILETSHIGAFKILTTDIWRTLSPGERRNYIYIRHPVTIFLGYFSTFLLSLCIQGFLRRPKRNWDGLLAIVLHLFILFTAVLYAELSLYIYAFLIPSIISGGIGTYIFYAQHNNPDVMLKDRQDWSYTYAAMNSTVFIKMSPFMNWVTANVGFHHIHHLNPRIPFYKLPQVMQEVEEFQDPIITSLHPRDIAACLRFKLWDRDRQRMVSYAEVN